MYLQRAIEILLRLEGGEAKTLVAAALVLRQVAVRDCPKVREVARELVFVQNIAHVPVSRNHSDMVVSCLNF